MLALENDFASTQPQNIRAEFPQLGWVNKTCLLHSEDSQIKHAWFALMFEFKDDWMFGYTPDNDWAYFPVQFQIPAKARAANYQQGMLKIFSLLELDETDAIFHQPSLGICTVEVNKHSAKGKKFLELIETCRGNYRTAYALCSLFTSANIGPINPIQFKYMRTQGNAVHAASCIQSHPGNTSSSINQFMQSHGINITVGDLTKDDLVQLAVSGTNLPYSLADKPDGFADRYSIPGRSGLSYREGLQLRYQSEGENAYDFTGEVPDFLQFALTLLTYQQETMMCNGRIPQKIKKNSAALG